MNAIFKKIQLIDQNKFWELSSILWYFHLKASEAITSRSCTPKNFPKLYVIKLCPNIFIKQIFFYLTLTLRRKFSRYRKDIWAYIAT